MTRPLRICGRRAPNLPEALIFDLEPGLHADGMNLYLRVLESGSRSWAMIYSFAGRRREMGLGSASVVTLSEAREMVALAKRQLVRGVDPIEARRMARRHPLPANDWPGAVAA